LAVFFKYPTGELFYVDFPNMELLAAVLAE